MKEQDIYAAGIALSIFLAFVFYLSPKGPGISALIVYSLIAVSILAVIILTVLYLKKQYPIKKLLVSIFIGILACGLLFMSYIYVLVLILDSVNGASYNYTISVTGLESLDPGSVDRVLVPMPVREGSPVFSDQDLQRVRAKGWDASAVTYNGEPMIAFTPQNDLLSDIHVSIARYSMGAYIKVEDPARDVVLVPYNDINDTIPPGTGDHIVEPGPGYLYMASYRSQGIIETTGPGSTNITMSANLIASNGRYYDRTGNDYLINAGGSAQIGQNATTIPLTVESFYRPGDPQ